MDSEIVLPERRYNDNQYLFQTSRSDYIHSQQTNEETIQLHNDHKGLGFFLYFPLFFYIFLFSYVLWF